MFQFELNDSVEITVSGENGIVVARANYTASQDQYLVRYKAADGRAQESWWPVEALAAF